MNPGSNATANNGVGDVRVGLDNHTDIEKQRSKATENGEWNEINTTLFFHD